MSGKYAFKLDEKNDEAKDILDINFEIPEIGKVIIYSIFIYTLLLYLTEFAYL